MKIISYFKVGITCLLLTLSCAHAQDAVLEPLGNDVYLLNISPPTATGISINPIDANTLNSAKELFINNSLNDIIIENYWSDGNDLIIPANPNLSSNKASTVQILFPNSITVKISGIIDVIGGVPTLEFKGLSGITVDDLIFRGAAIGKFISGSNDISIIEDGVTTLGQLSFEGNQFLVSGKLHAGEKVHVSAQSHCLFDLGASVDIAADFDALCAGRLLNQGEILVKDKFTVIARSITNQAMWYKQLWGEERMNKAKDLGLDNPSLTSGTRQSIGWYDVLEREEELKHPNSGIIKAGILDAATIGKISNRDGALMQFTGFQNQNSTMLAGQGIINQAYAASNQEGVFKEGIDYCPSIMLFDSPCFLSAGSGQFLNQGSTLAFHAPSSIYAQANITEVELGTKFLHHSTSTVQGRHYTPKLIMGTWSNVHGVFALESIKKSCAEYFLYDNSDITEDDCALLGLRPSCSGPLWTKCMLTKAMSGSDKVAFFKDYPSCQKIFCIRNCFSLNREVDAYLPNNYGIKFTSSQPTYETARSPSVLIGTDQVDYLTDGFIEQLGAFRVIKGNEFLTGVLGIISDKSKFDTGNGIQEYLRAYAAVEALSPAFSTSMATINNELATTGTNDFYGTRGMTIVSGSSTMHSPQGEVNLLGGFRDVKSEHINGEKGVQLGNPNSISHKKNNLPQLADSPQDALVLNDPVTDQLVQKHAVDGGLISIVREDSTITAPNGEITESAAIRAIAGDEILSGTHGVTIESGIIVDQNNNPINFDAGGLSLVGGKSVISSSNGKVKIDAALVIASILEMSGSDGVVIQPKLSAYIQQVIQQKGLNAVIYAFHGRESIVGSSDSYVKLSPGAKKLLLKGSTIIAGLGGVIINGDAELTPVTETAYNQFTQTKRKFFQKTKSEETQSTSKTFFPRIHSAGDISFLGKYNQMLGAVIRSLEGKVLIPDGAELSIKDYQVPFYYNRKVTTSGFKMPGIPGATIEALQGKDIGDALEDNIGLLSMIADLRKADSLTDAAPAMRLGTQIYQLAEEFSNRYEENGEDAAKAALDTSMSHLGFTKVGKGYVPSGISWYKSVTKEHYSSSSIYHTEIDGKVINISVDDAHFVAPKFTADQFSLNVKNALKFLAAEISSQRTIDQHSQSFGVHIGESSLTVAAGGSSSKSKFVQTQFVPGSVHAQSVNINVGDETQLQGLIVGEVIAMKVEGVLILETLQDESSIKEKSKQADASLTFNSGGIISGSLGYGQGKGKGSTKEVGSTQTSITGSQVDIEAAAIDMYASTISGQNGTVNAPVIEHHDIHDHHDYKSHSFYLSSDPAVMLKKAILARSSKESASASTGSMSFDLKSEKRRAVHRSTISPGLNIESNSDTSSLNRDPANAYQTLVNQSRHVSLFIPILDLQKLKDNSKRIGQTFSDIKRQTKHKFKTWRAEVGDKASVLDMIESAWANVANELEKKDNNIELMLSLQHFIEGEVEGRGLALSARGIDQNGNDWAIIQVNQFNGDLPGDVPATLQLAPHLLEGGNNVEGLVIKDRSDIPEVFELLHKEAPEQMGVLRSMLQTLKTELPAVGKATVLLPITIIDQIYNGHVELWNFSQEMNGGTFSQDLALIKNLDDGQLTEVVKEVGTQMAKEAYEGFVKALKTPEGRAQLFVSFVAGKFGSIIIKPIPSPKPKPKKLPNKDQSTKSNPSPKPDNKPDSKPSKTSKKKKVDANNKAKIWEEIPIVRGNAIEDYLALTEYKDYFRVGKLNRGYFPLIDFQLRDAVVSVKTVDTRGKTWVQRTKAHIEELGERDAISIDDVVTKNIRLDLRVQPGGKEIAKKMLEQAADDRNIKLIVTEFK